MVVREVESLFKTYLHDPIFGVQFTVEAQASKLSDRTVHRQMDDVEIIDSEATSHDALAAYYADGSNKDQDKAPILNPYLGLAVEQLPATVTLEDLWSVL